MSVNTKNVFSAIIAISTQWMNEWMFYVMENIQTFK